MSYNKTIAAAILEEVHVALRDKTYRGFNLVPEALWSAPLTDVRRGGLVITQERPRELSFEEAVTRFLTWSKTNTATSTYKIDGWASKKWLGSERFAGKALADIQREDVEGFKAEIAQFKVENRTAKHGQIISKKTQDELLGRLKHMFAYMEDLGYIKISPALRVKLHRQGLQRRRYLRVEPGVVNEYAQLLRACYLQKGKRRVPDMFLRRLIRLAVATGMRKDEMLGLTWDEVDLANGVIVLQAWRTKSKRVRVIQLNNTALSVLRSMQPPLCSGLVFANGNGRKEKSLARRWSRAVRASGLLDFTFHDLRHTYASWMAQKGCDMAALKELMGHSDLKMTERYAHLGQNNLKDAVALLDDPKRAKRHGSATHTSTPSAPREEASA